MLDPISAMHATLKLPPTRMNPATDIEEEQRAKLRSDKLDAKNPCCTIENDPAILAKSRRDKLLANSTPPITDSWKQEPKHLARPTAEQAEPILTKFLIERLLPNWLKSRTDNAEPHRVCRRTDMEEAKLTKFNAETADPMRANDRTETELPICIKSSTESAEPQRTNERSDKLEPIVPTPITETL
jgi:hypothetical protein